MLCLHLEIRFEHDRDRNSVIEMVSQGILVHHGSVENPTLSESDDRTQ